MKPLVAIVHWLPDGELARWTKEFPQVEFVETRTPETQDVHLARADVVYGMTDLSRLEKAPRLKWIQLGSAGVPLPLCGLAKSRNIRLTNLAGLYGPTIAEHALGMMLFLSRNLYVAAANQRAGKWDRTVAGTMRDLSGRTLALIGVGNIGQNLARLARGLGMRVVGCRRRPQPTPFVDQVWGPEDVRAPLREAEYVAVTAPLTSRTEGMLGPEEFDAMRDGTIYINVSRGTVAQEQALLAALRSGKIVAAGLDVFAVEPLPADHPFWAMPNVLVSPHYSGDVVNTGRLPAERFARNLRRWLAGNAELEGVVDCDQGY